MNNNNENIFDKNYNLDTVDEFFDNLKDKSVMNKYRVYAGFKNNQNEIERRRYYENNFGFENEIHSEATIVSDDIVIVKVTNYNKNRVNNNAWTFKDIVYTYFAIVNNKRSYYAWNTFDDALICALSIKYTGNEKVAKYVKKLFVED